MSGRLITSESVTEGHPDKLCDQISDAILDDLLRQDPTSHVAVETCATTGQFVVFGEVTSSGYCDIPAIVRSVVKKVGYTSSQIGLDADSCGIMVALTSQSSEINQGVNRSVALGNKSGSSSINNSGQETNVIDNNFLNDCVFSTRELSHTQYRQKEDRYALQGAGDQGIMFGYACDESEGLISLPIYLAHRLAHRLATVRKQGIVKHLRPDGKTQVTIEYNEEHRPVRLDTIVLSTQHDPEVNQQWLQQRLQEFVVLPVLHEVLDKLSYTVQYDNYRLLVNPTGSFVLGGPAADAGLTGRKIIVDTYGGSAHHGGGAFSGKDPSKVDRSAAYAARWVAKNIVAAKLAHTVEVQIAYAIGVAQPVSIDVETFGTEQSGITRSMLQNAVLKVFDLRPAAIIDELQLLQPMYAKTATYGHFGRPDEQFTWEQTNKVKDLQSAIHVLQHSAD